MSNKEFDGTLTVASYQREEENKIMLNGGREKFGMTTRISFDGSRNRHSCNLSIKFNLSGLKINTSDGNLNYFGSSS